MQNISANDLDLVTGGTPSATQGPSTSSTGSGSCPNSALLTSLQSIQSSLSDLGKNQNQGLFGGQNGLLFMTMALAMQRRNEVVVYGNRWGGGGYYWRSGW